MGQSVEYISNQHENSSYRQHLINETIQSLGNVSSKDKIEIFKIVTNHLGTLTKNQLENVSVDQPTLTNKDLIKEQLVKILKENGKVKEVAGLADKQYTLNSDKKSLERLEQKVTSIGKQFGAIQASPAVGNAISTNEAKTYKKGITDIAKEGAKTLSKTTLTKDQYKKATTLVKELGKTSTKITKSAKELATYAIQPTQAVNRSKETIKKPEKNMMEKAVKQFDSKQSSLKKFVSESSNKIIPNLKKGNSKEHAK